MNRRFLLLPLIIICLITGCGLQDKGDATPSSKPRADESQALSLALESPKPFEFVITDKVRPFQDSLDGGVKRGKRPIGAYEKESGAHVEFLLDEVLIKPKDKGELANFLQTYAGTIISDNRVPELPPEFGLIDPAYHQPTRYLVKISRLPALSDSFTQEAQAIGRTGVHRFSNEAGAQLFALVAHEQAAGRNVRLNHLSHGADYLRHGTIEGNNTDAFKWDEFTSTGAHLAWQYLWLNGYHITNANNVKLVVIDGGFWLNPMNGDIMVGKLGIDIPTHPNQYDFNDDDANASGENPGTCSSPCPWHGNGVVSIAAGFINNGGGAAGTGGIVAKPFLFKVDYSESQIGTALRTAAAIKADVVNMSFGAEDNEGAFEDALQAVVDAGGILVAAAGNDGHNVDVKKFWPCIYPKAICVGALDSSNKRAFYSNFGASVDIYAPTGIHVMPNGDSPDSITRFGGTSASAPYVAGVIAMMRAIDPSLNFNTIKTFLHDTAGPYSALNSWGAVLQSAISSYKSSSLKPDKYEPNDTHAQARELKTLTINPFDEFNVSLTDNDYFHFNAEKASSVLHLDIECLGGFPLEAELWKLEGTVWKQVDLHASYSSGYFIVDQQLPYGEYDLVVKVSQSTFTSWTPNFNDPVPYHIVGFTVTPVPFSPAPPSSCGGWSYDYATHCDRTIRVRCGHSDPSEGNPVYLLEKETGAGLFTIVSRDVYPYDAYGTYPQMTDYFSSWDGSVRQYRVCAQNPYDTTCAADLVSVFIPSKNPCTACGGKPCPLPKHPLPCTPECPDCCTRGEEGRGVDN